MLFRSTNRPDAPPTLGAEVPDEHKGIKQIRQLVLLCAGVLVVSACLLVGTALQVMGNIDQIDVEAERQRAANAIDTITAEAGALTAASASMLGRVAGLRDARLAFALSADPAIQQIPLLAGKGPAGSYLIWTRTTLAQETFLRFAPIRLPIIGGMMVVVLNLLMLLLRIVGDVERQRRTAHLQSRSDALTGLANRLALEGKLAELTQAGSRFAVLVLDLDRFKDINDAFGHAAGDAVLHAVGARLAALMTPLDLLARVGGDEFTMVLVSRSDPAALSALAEQSIAAVEQPIRIAQRFVTVGISLGIVPPVATPHLPAALVDMADAALYRAKSRPGSSFAFAGDDMVDNAVSLLRASA